MGHRQPWVDAMRRERGAAVAAPALHVFGTGRPGENKGVLDQSARCIQEGFVVS